jgi:hypothetical protein
MRTANISIKYLIVSIKYLYLIPGIMSYKTIAGDVFYYIIFYFNVYDQKTKLYLAL